MRLSPRYDGPPMLSIEGEPAALREPVTRQRRRMETLLAGLDDDAWTAPTRCDRWTVQDVVAHLVTVNNFWSTSVAEGVAGTPTRMLAAFDPAAHPDLLVDPMRALTPGEVLDQLVASNDRLLALIDDLDDAGWQATAEAPAGHLPMHVVARHALWDAWIHERDIALPLGIEPAREPDELRSCLRFAAAIGPALTVGAATAVGAVGAVGAVDAGGRYAVAANDPDDAFVLEVGEAVAVRDVLPDPDVPCLRGPAADLVDALSIRAPLPAGAPPEWRRARSALATVFDTGPA